MDMASALKMVIVNVKTGTLALIALRVNHYLFEIFVCVSF